MQNSMAVRFLRHPKDTEGRDHSLTSTGKMVLVSTHSKRGAHSRGKWRSLYREKADWDLLQGGS